MTTAHRFEVTPVYDMNREKDSEQSSEMIPLINIETNTPSPSPQSSLPFTVVNETTKHPNRLVNSFFHRSKPHSSSTDLMQKDEIATLPTHSSSHSAINLTMDKEGEEPDSYHSTMHTLDTNSLRFTDKFLHELRLKRRELNEKGKHLPIDQRIALNRFKYKRNIKRAQDIFNVNFAPIDEDDVNMPNDTFNENAQEQIRENIFNELDRQRIKQLHKQHRHLVVGRALLMFVTSLLLFMSITLIYVVTDLYHRAHDLNATLTDNEFISIVYDTTEV